MEIEKLIPHIEALVFASDRPLTLLELVEMLSMALELPLDGERVQVGLEAIGEKYDSDHYPFQLRDVGGGYQFLTKKAFHKTVLQLNGNKHIKKLSPAAMETLAIVAYKQPITKAEIEYIRGVSADYSLQKLLEKELIVITGRKEDMPGKPLTYATARSFMDYLGISSPEELPQLKEIQHMEVVVPTDGQQAQAEDHPSAPQASLRVSADGSLLPSHKDAEGE